LIVSDDPASEQYRDRCRQSSNVRDAPAKVPIANSNVPHQSGNVGRHRGRLMWFLFVNATRRPSVHDLVTRPVLISLKC
jgi:hypothetical protein